MSAAKVATSKGNLASPLLAEAVGGGAGSTGGAILLAVVSLSYRQVCRGYPNGGGAYIVAKTNLAPIFGLVAAASLLIDYVMTVAVSTAAAIVQIQSSVPAAYEFRIEIALVSITLITIANLRGLRESGNIFAIPTYLFIGLALTIEGEHENRLPRRDHLAGLGLSLARSIAERDGGTIGAESTPGDGSAFWVELPVPADG